MQAETNSTEMLVLFSLSASVANNFRLRLQDTLCSMVPNGHDHVPLPLSGNAESLALIDFGPIQAENVCEISISFAR